MINGLVVTEDKIPIMAQVLSGGMSDKKWVYSLVDTLVAFYKQLCTKEIVLVADSALVSKDNLKKIKEKENQGIA